MFSLQFSISLTGKEFDCKYSNFKSNMHSREDYLKTLSLCVEKSVHPTLIHVHAFQDLPTDEEKQISVIKSNVAGAVKKNTGRR